jgi:prepilin-type N-terminal cleavage/methylation domain-containing protein
MLQSRTAFTLIEMLLVLAVIVGLAAISYPAYGRLTERNRIDATRNLVAAAWTALDAEERRVLHLAQAGGEAQVLPRWDLDRDGVLDGDPRRWSGSIATLATRLDYGGFLRETGAPFGTDARDDAGHVVDPWGRPLRVVIMAFPPQGSVQNPEQAGGHWAGVWSLGPDGEPLTEDDIRSW